MTTEIFFHRVVGASNLPAEMAAWCDERGLGSGDMRSKVHVRVGRADLPDPFPISHRPDEPVFFRSITLFRGVELAVLDADNWFLPTRLPPESVEKLLNGDTPFASAIPADKQSRRITRIAIPRGSALGIELDHSVVVVEDDAVSVLHVHSVINLGGRSVAFTHERLRDGLV